MKVLLSIKPEYAKKILSGEKKYEFRKTIFKDKTITKIVIYATKPVGKVIGEFDIDCILKDQPDSIWKKTEKYSGISQEFFKKYFNNRESAFAIKVKNPSTYEEPLDISSIIPNGTPPQSFCYVK